jgi:hypothetical protein
LIRTLTKSGIYTLGDLTQAMEYETDRRVITTMNLVMTQIPSKLREIARCFNEDINSDEDNLKHFKIEKGQRVRVNDITSKQLQVILKNVLKKTETLDVKSRVDIDNFDMENIMNFRKSCKNSKLRHIYFRLIHNDFFTHVKMKKYKMTNSDKCPRCEEMESTKHLLWECNYVKSIWTLYNVMMNKLNLQNEKVLKYEDVYSPGLSVDTCLIKIRVIQELIQIERPKNWTEEKIIKISNELINLEKYNATVKRTLPKFLKIWHRFLTN